MQYCFWSGPDLLRARARHVKRETMTCTPSKMIKFNFGIYLETRWMLRERKRSKWLCIDFAVYRFFVYMNLSVLLTFGANSTLKTDTLQILCFLLALWVEIVARLKPQSTGEYLKIEMNLNPYMVLVYCIFIYWLVRNLLPMFADVKMFKVVLKRT